MNHDITAHVMVDETDQSLPVLTTPLLPHQPVPKFLDFEFNSMIPVINLSHSPLDAHPLQKCLNRHSI